MGGDLGRGEEDVEGMKMWGSRGVRSRKVAGLRWAQWVLWCGRVGSHGRTFRGNIEGCV